MGWKGTQLTSEPSDLYDDCELFKMNTSESLPSHCGWLRGLEYMINISSRWYEYPLVRPRR